MGADCDQLTQRRELLAELIDFDLPPDLTFELMGRGFDLIEKGRWQHG